MYLTFLYIRFLYNLNFLATIFKKISWAALAWVSYSPPIQLCSLSLTWPARVKIYKKNVHITTPFVLFLKCGYFMKYFILEVVRGTSLEQCTCPFRNLTTGLNHRARVWKLSTVCCHVSNKISNPVVLDFVSGTTWTDNTFSQVALAFISLH